MQTNQINPLVILATMVILVGLIGYFGFRAVSPSTPPAGSYTPGVPPWLDKKNPNYGKIQSPPGAAKPAQGTAGQGAGGG